LRAAFYFFSVLGVLSLSLQLREIKCFLAVLRRHHGATANSNVPIHADYFATIGKRV
jgi:hypothetical protein